jgi:hypothetical protein
VSDLLPRDFASRAFQLEIPTDIPRLESVELRDLHKEDDFNEPEFLESHLRFLESHLTMTQARLAELRVAEFEQAEFR